MKLTRKVVAIFLKRVVPSAGELHTAKWSQSVEAKDKCGSNQHIESAKIGIPQAAY